MRGKIGEGHQSVNERDSRKREKMIQKEKGN